ncbi:MAG: HAMP domain-containing protein [Anaerolineae bacterium]|nr:HAMP domain-containing protein [Anaerolineae bacterium]
MTLRTRLLLSYLVLLSITLAVMVLALIVFLFAQPVAPDATYEQLATIARDVIADSGLRDGSRPTLAELRDLRLSLPQIAADNEVRILIANFATQTVNFDSDQTFTDGAAITIDSEVYTLPTYLRRSLGLLSEPSFGSFRDADGTRWLFTGLSLLRDNAVLLAEPAPRQTLANVLATFRRELARPLIQAAFIGLVVAALLAAWISSNLSRVLARLVKAAEAVAAGAPDTTVPLQGPPEVRSVAAAFNRMNAEVQDAQRSQQDFLINVSHDLKTPLTSIQGYSQAIMDGAARDPASAAQIIHEEAGRLNRMVTELTDLARLQSGRFSMQSVPVDLGQLARAVGERLAILAQEKYITLNIEAASLPPVAGDGDRLAQVVTNLVSNAIKYTPAGGKIWMKAGVNGSGVELTVRDSGIGIAPQDLPRVFERFYQADKARGPQRGTGLGLAITQEIVQAHGGKISVNSPGQNQGSTFTVWLPLAQSSTVTRRKA